MKKTYFLLVFILILTAPSLKAEEKSTANITLTTRLTESYPLQMPVLKPYPIYINASVDDPDTIHNVAISVNGTAYPVQMGTGFYYFLWTPDAYGPHQIVIMATSAQGLQRSLTRNIEVVATASSKAITSLKDVVIEFGGANSRWYYGTYTFPQFVGAYKNLKSFLNVACPNVSGGCDDWDRVAYIDVKAPDGNWIQLIRYITPYGVACSHQLDVTDYMSLLQGEVEMRVFIDTWGTGGWQLTLQTYYTAGAPQYAYSDVVEIWDDLYSFGDPANLQPVPTANLDIPSKVQSSHLRVSTTGHGWGQNNSQNAAEFFNATHYFDVNGTQTFTQNLWNQCNPNPDNCTGQAGTWQHNRAGWCPGAISPPDSYDMSTLIGSTFSLDYRFHPNYQDYCHPNNPNCVSGQTCPDCNDGANPIYYVDAHLINKSNNPMVYGNVLGTPKIDNANVFNVSIYPNPASHSFRVNTSFPDSHSRVTLQTIDGKIVKTYYFDSSTTINNYDFDVSNLSQGIYFLNIENTYGTGVKRIAVE